MVLELELFDNPRGLEPDTELAGARLPTHSAPSRALRKRRMRSVDGKQGPPSTFLPRLRRPTPATEPNGAHR
jgi:hypothetical protein